MARHRSPRGRHAHQSSAPAAPRRAVPESGARRSVSVPLRRGTAVVAVTGGALSLVAAAVPLQPPAQMLGQADASGTKVLAVARALPVEAAPALMRATLQPVAPEPRTAGAADLVKAVQLAEQEVERRAAEERAAQERAAQEAQEKAARDAAASRKVVAQPAAAKAATGSPDCGLSTSGLGGVKSHVRDAAEFLGCLFGQPRILGVASRGSGSSDHPSGLALDFMVDRSTGDALAECALRNQDALGITYVIWRQRINHGSGWKPMDDRGSATANHFDHVHVSFGGGRGSGSPSC